MVVVGGCNSNNVVVVGGCWQADSFKSIKVAVVCEENKIDFD